MPTKNEAPPRRCRKRSGSRHRRRAAESVNALRMKVMQSCVLQVIPEGWDASSPPGLFFGKMPTLIKFREKIVFPRMAPNFPQGFLVFQNLAVKNLLNIIRQLDILPIAVPIGKTDIGSGRNLVNNMLIFKFYTVEAFRRFDVIIKAVQKCPHLFFILCLKFIFFLIYLFLSFFLSKSVGRIFPDRDCAEIEIQTLPATFANIS